MVSALFVYGTLECPELVFALTGTPSHAAPAVLSGFRRGLMEARRYPGIVPSPSHSVSGAVYTGLDDEALRLVDCYEADEYERLEVDVRYPDGRCERVFAYVVREGFRDLVTAEPWDTDAFRTKHLREYVEHCTQLRLTEFGKSKLPRSSNILDRSEKSDSSDDV